MPSLSVLGKLGPGQLGPGAQLSRAQLSGAQLSGAQFAGAQFALNQCEDRARFRKAGFTIFPYGVRKNSRFVVKILFHWEEHCWLLNWTKNPCRPLFISRTWKKNWSGKLLPTKADECFLITFFLVKIQPSEYPIPYCTIPYCHNSMTPPH